MNTNVITDILLNVKILSSFVNNNSYAKVYERYGIVKSAFE